MLFQFRQKLIALRYIPVSVEKGAFGTIGPVSFSFSGFTQLGDAKGAPNSSAGNIKEITDKCLCKSF